MIQFDGGAYFPDGLVKNHQLVYLLIYLKKSTKFMEHIPARRPRDERMGRWDPSTNPKFSASELWVQGFFNSLGSWWQPEIRVQLTSWGKGIFGPNYLQGLSTIPGDASSGFLNHQQYGLIGSLMLYLARFSTFQVINSDFWTISSIISNY